MSSTPTPAAPEAPQPQSSLIGRMFGALFSPGETFPEVVRTQSWIGPIILLTILSICVGYVLNQRVDWDSFLRREMEKSPRFTQLSPDQQQQQLTAAQKFVPYQVYIVSALGTTVGGLIIAGVYCLAFNLVKGAGVKFKTAFAITAHAMMPSSLASIIAVVIMYLKSPGDIDPKNLIASNAGALLGSETPKWLESLASSLDFFSFWIMFLLAVGFAATNPRKLKTGGAMGVVVAVWAVWVLIKVAWAQIFS